MGNHLLEICDIFVGNDSGLAHLATAVKTSTITLFGPEDPRKFSPYGNNCTVIYKKLPCSPCGQTECIRPENSCMDLITVDEVFEEIKKLISRHNSINNDIIKSIENNQKVKIQT